MRCRSIATPPSGLQLAALRVRLEVSGYCLSSPSSATAYCPACLVAFCVVVRALHHQVTPTHPRELQQVDPEQRFSPCAPCRRPACQRGRGAAEFSEFGCGVICIIPGVVQPAACASKTAYDDTPGRPSPPLPNLPCRHLLLLRRVSDGFAPPPPDAHRNQGISRLLGAPKNTSTRTPGNKLRWRTPRNTDATALPSPPPGAAEDDIADEAL